jgi:hypothetical protein
MTTPNRGPRKGSTVAGTARKTEPDPLERYYTPQPIALSLCRRWQKHIAGQWAVDPFAGGGVWLNAALEVGAASVEGCDLDPLAPVVTAGRAVVGHGVEYIGRLYQREVVLTNPPFSLTNATVQAIQAAIIEGRISAAIMLARLTMAEGQGRRHLWRAFPPAAAVVPAGRIAWDGPGGDLMAGTDNFGSLAVLWTAERVAYGETRIALGWDPSDEGVGGQQVELLGGAR